VRRGRAWLFLELDEALCSDEPLEKNWIGNCFIILERADGGGVLWWSDRERVCVRH
jgi:hypothetical protein